MGFQPLTLGGGGLSPESPKLCARLPLGTGAERGRREVPDP